MTSRSTASPAALSAAKKTLLEQRLQSARQQPLRTPSIPRRAERDRAPLSFAQQRLWFLDQWEPNSPMYNMPIPVRIRGMLNVQALQLAFRGLIERHEILRTRFVSVEGEPVQEICPVPELSIPIEDLRNVTRASRDAELNRLLREHARRPFNLSEGLLIRCQLFRMDEQEHVLLINMHHIASDAWSFGIIFQELSSLYEAALRGETVRLPELPIQYGDYAAWQRDALQESLRKHLEYWKQKLAGAPDLLELPTDHPRPAMQTFHGKHHLSKLPAELSKALRKVAQQAGATQFMMLLAAFKVLLHKYCRQDDILVGSPIAGRTQVETESLVGFFINTLVLRSDLSGNPNFVEFLERVKTTTLEAYNHQELPFEKLVEELRPERTPSYSPLVQTMFVLHTAPQRDLKLGDSQVEFLDVDTATSKFDLILSMAEGPAGMDVDIEFNANLFEEDSIRRLLQNFQTLLEAIVEDPKQRLSELPIISAQEREKLLVTWSQTQRDYPRNSSLAELFEAQVDHAPDRVALVDDASWTYSELNGRANRLAHFLHRSGLEPDTPVAIFLDRGAELISTLLGILKAGGAYMPLDRAYPKDRMAYMLEDAKAPVLITESKLLGELPPYQGKVICLDRDAPEIAAESSANLKLPLTGENIAYVLYTSGSTGKPKGVCIPQRGVARLVLNVDYAPLISSDIIAQVSNCSFDAATWEIWAALLNGARLVIFRPDVLLSPNDFAARLRGNNVNCLFVTTALLNQFAAEDPSVFRGLKYLISGGEALDPKWVAEVLKKSPPQRFINAYGPTESTTYATCYQIQTVPEGAHNIPIGRPVPNTTAYILDRYLQPLPVGVPGEIFIGGDGLARGYLGKPELTAEKFIRNPFGSEPNARLYRTGDLARYLPSGDIEFLGRVDDQVKIRGFRVELGEIESVLSQHSKVRQCAVTVRQDAAGAKQLVAYYVPREQSAINSDELKDFLQSRLPSYMVPAFWVQLDQLPLTPNGKVNRRALPAPDTNALRREGDRLAPRDETENQLQKIWQDVLGISEIGIRDRFFDLGGHSLLALRLVAQIEKKFGRKISVTTIFQRPTIEQLAAVLRDGLSAQSTTSLVEIQPQGKRPPLVLVHGVGGGMFWGYSNLARHLGNEQPLYAFKSRGLDGLKEYETIEEMAKAYVADLKTFQPHGPYYLGGYCFGGNVAYEMARILHESGEKIGMLALMNSNPPNSSYTRIRITPLFLARFVINLWHWGTNALRWSPAQRRDFIRWKLKLIRKDIQRRFGRPAAASVDSDIEDWVDISTYPEDQQKLWETHIRALVNYHPKPYEGHVTLFRSRAHHLISSYDPQYGWTELANGGVTVRIIPGAHEKIIDEPNVKVLAAELKKCLAEAQAANEANPARPAAPSALPAAQPSSDGATNKISQEIPQTNAPSLNKEEKRPGVTDRNNTHAKFPLDRSYPELFEKQAQSTPELIAIRNGQCELTYAELYAKSSALSRRLAREGVGPEVIVAVALNRSIELPISFLAVLKAGGAFLPLDTSLPAERLKFLLEDSGARLVLTTELLRNRIPTTQARVLALEELEMQQPSEPADSHNTHATPETLAYVMYTSGSTGVPKGVEITHRSLVNHNYAIAEAFGLSSADRILQFGSLTFDLSIEEMFPAWLRGATVVFRPDDVLASETKLLDFVARERITILDLPTAYWHELVDACKGKTLPDCVRLVVIGGEQASVSHWRTWSTQIRHSARLLNTYGPTEATVTATMQPCDQLPSDAKVFPIGRPIANARAYVLGPDLKPAPIGEAGELHIGGAGVARGYLNRPELTAQKFIPNPFVAGERLYKTGDLARFLEDGSLEFLGRADDQVKIRGCRVEPGELETVLSQHPAVDRALVLARKDSRNENRLAAYYVVRDGQNVSRAELLRFLKARLPDYLIPAALVRLDAVPINRSGKIDRGALPTPQFVRPELDEPYVSPQTDFEAAVSKIWCEVLGVDRVGLKDNFFKLGGHSLNAMQIISRTQAQFDIQVPVAEFFADPTLGAFVAGLLKAKTEQKKKSLSPIKHASRAGDLPLSFAQQRLWFLDQLHPNSAVYNLPQPIRLLGRLNIPALEKALNEIVRRHEALRTNFITVMGSPVQKIAPSAHLRLECVDLSSLDPSVRGTELHRLLQAEAQRPFDLQRDLMLRALLVQVEHETAVLLLTIHHIVSDAWSIGHLLEELAMLYDSFSKNRPSPLSDVAIQYADFAVWQREWIAEEVLQEQLAYWQKQLKDTPSLFEWPADHPRPAIESHRGGNCRFQVSTELTDRLKALAQEEGCTLFMALLAAFQTLASRYTGREDIVTGSVIANRNRPELEPLIGFFVNTLALRTRVDPRLSFRELLQRVRTITLEAYAHQDLPFEKLVEELQPERDTSFHPLIQTMLVLQNVPMPDIPGSEVSWVPFELDVGQSRFDLTLELSETAKGLAARCEYALDLFEPATIEHLTSNFQLLLQSAVDDPDAPVSELNLLSESEQRRLLVDWNRTELEFPKDVCLHELFEAQARKTPDAVAVVFQNEQITFGDLNRRSDALARYLSTQGAGPELLVAICHERTPELIVAIMAVLKSGAAYVPIDSGYPKERIDFILEDTRAPIVLTQKKLFDRFRGRNAKIICLDDLEITSAEPRDGRRVASANSRTAAYVIFTSGSTGRPKGVVVEHRSAVNLVYWAKSVYTPDELSGMLAATSVCFDLSVFEMFVPLCLGGKIILAENALQLSSLPAAKQVTLVNTVPSAMTQILGLNALPDSVQVVNLAGEPLTRQLVDRLYAKNTVRKVYDLYGPTEDTVYATFALRAPGGPQTIGRPVANNAIYILSPQRQPVPQGVAGELYIGGDGLARGYLNRPEMTAERFIPNPFGGRPDARLYRTGDLARYLPDGNIEFLGRIDHQVKVRGFRIELGEIEENLRHHPLVRDAVVTAREDGSGDKRLAAYVTAKNGTPPRAQELQDFLQARLPDYMVPPHVVVLDALPLTTNGKVDRKALPDPDGSRPALESAFVEPTTEIEILLAKIWREVLEIEKVGIHDNFFKLGGHSLKVTQVISRVRESLQVELPMRSVFEAPTIASLAAIVEELLIKEIDKLSDDEARRLNDELETSV